MSSIGKILLSIVEIGAVIALSIFAPEIATTLGIAGALGVSATTAAFIVVAVGSIVITTGFTLLSAALFNNAPGIDQAKVNTRISAPPRYIAGGAALVGGAVVFGEFDADGNLWYILIHCDSILTSPIQYFFDNEPVTFDGTGDGEGWCVTDDFCLNGNSDPYKTGDSTRKTFFYAWTRTFTETNPVPPPVPALQTAFPDKWTTIDHLLVGTTYTVIRASAIKIANRYKIYRWRGALGLGEPAVAIAGNWSNMYDPRDNTQILGNRATYKPSSNSELVWAWFRTHPFGRAKLESTMNWDLIGQQATICDQSIVGIESTQPRYRAATAVIDSKERFTAEQEIMMSCDGQLVFDEQGLTWLRVGAYYDPTLMLSRNRDIIAMQSMEPQDGESVTQGVIVNYIDPEAGYTTQPSAAWYNPNYYVEGLGNTFLTVNVLTCQNHNQAMRIAKSVGMRSQPVQKLAPTVGLRGLRAMQERIINIQYDNTFAGDYEICTPIEVDASGFFCSLGLVPMDDHRFDLLPGEEKPKPVADDALITNNTPDEPSEVDVFFQNGAIFATFDAPVRNDVTFYFQYIDTTATDGHWLDMSVDMDNKTASSGSIDTTDSYFVQWRAVTSGGDASAWVQTTLGASVVPMPTVTDLTATGNSGSIAISWRDPTDSRFAYADLYSNSTNDKTTWTKISANRVGSLGMIDNFNDTVISGTMKYYWVIANNSDGSISSIAEGPVSATAT